MTILPVSILVVGRLSKEFVASFVDYICSLCSSSRQLFILWPAGGNETANSKYFNEEMKIFYGSPANEQLVKKIIDENKINVVIHFNEHSCHQFTGASIAENARQLLAVGTCFLEALRNCAQPPTLVEAFFSSSENSQIGVSLNGDGQLAGTFRTASLNDANFASAVALFHSYAISYRLSIQVANFEAVNDGERAQTATHAFDQLMELATLQPGKAQISHFKYAPQLISATTESKPAARFLVYSDATSELGKQFFSRLDAASIEYVIGKLRVDSACENTLQEEIITVAPSHIVLLPQQPQSGEDVAVYNELGAENLLKNMRENVFAPLSLANICAKMSGIHFSYANSHSTQSLRQLLLDNETTSYSSAVPPSAKQQSQSDATDTTKTAPPEGKEDCFETAKRFTDSTLKFFEKCCLNAKINASNKEQIQNCANKITHLALAQKVGVVDFTKSDLLNSN